MNSRNWSLKVLSGTANRELAEKIAARLGVELCSAVISRFSDGEIKVAFDENIRGTDLFVVQPTPPPGDNLLELLVMIDAARRASARRITAVIPYFGYARQDRKDRPRVPLTAKLVANLIETAGADRVLAIELHSGQIQGFFDLPVDHLYAGSLIVGYYKEYFESLGLNIPNEVVVVSPDLGAVKVGKAWAKKLGCPVAALDKDRLPDGSVKINGLMGRVKNRVAVSLDDMISTASTITADCEYLIGKKAREVYLGATHGLFAGEAIKRLEASGAKKVVVTNTLHLNDLCRSHPLIHCLDMSETLANAIKAIHTESSVTAVCFVPTV